MAMIVHYKIVLVENTSVAPAPMAPSSFTYAGVKISPRPETGDYNTLLPGFGPLTKENLKELNEKIKKMHMLSSTSTENELHMDPRIVICNVMDLEGKESTMDEFREEMKKILDDYYNTSRSDNYKDEIIDFLEMRADEIGRLLDNYNNEV